MILITHKALVRNVFILSNLNMYTFMLNNSPEMYIFRKISHMCLFECLKKLDYHKHKEILP